MDQKRLKELLHYDPATGVFTWIVSPRANVKAGDRAGHTRKKDGRIDRVVIRIDGSIYYAHRLAWLYIKGKWPKKEIDHKNVDATDNRFTNLRDVSHAVNMDNRKRAQKNSLTGFLGVTRNTHGKKFTARLQCNGNYILDSLRLSWTQLGGQAGMWAALAIMLAFVLILSGFVVYSSVFKIGAPSHVFRFQVFHGNTEFGASRRGVNVFVRNNREYIETLIGRGSNGCKFVGSKWFNGATTCRIVIAGMHYDLQPLKRHLREWKTTWQWMGTKIDQGSKVHFARWRLTDVTNPKFYEWNSAIQPSGINCIGSNRNIGAQFFLSSFPCLPQNAQSECGNKRGNDSEGFDKLVEIRFGLFALIALVGGGLLCSYGWISFFNGRSFWGGGAVIISVFLFLFGLAALRML